MPPGVMITHLLRQNRLDNIAYKLQSGAISQLHSVAIESDGRINARHHHFGAHSLDVDTVDALQIAENSVVGDVGHPHPLPIC